MNTGKSYGLPLCIYKEKSYFTNVLASLKAR